LYINEFAKFYNYPVISWADVAWPSFVRHFISSRKDRPNVWPLTIDGIHFTIPACELIVEHILGPFFIQVMQPRIIESNESEFSMYDHDLRMFAPRVFHTEIDGYSTWNDVMNNTLQNVIVNPSTNWSFEHTNHHNFGHYCYHSKVHNAVATFRINVSFVCTVLDPCTIGLTSLFTWNVSYIGSLSCSLYKLTTHNYINNSANVSHQFMLNTRHKVCPDVSISGWHLKGGTVPYESILSSNLTQGFYEIDCVNVDIGKDGKAKEACIIGVNVYGMLTV
jgi:hypothetical protein